jgi:hypothetical protein
MSFSQWLEAQKGRDETLPQYAARLGVPYTTLWYLINRQQEPNSRTIRTVAKGLKRPIEDVWKEL